MIALPSADFFVDDSTDIVWFDKGEKSDAEGEKEVEDVEEKEFKVFVDPSMLGDHAAVDQIAGLINEKWETGFTETPKPPPDLLG